MTKLKLSGPSRGDKKLPFLYLITNRKLCHPKPLEEVVLESLDAGISFIQLREKDLNSRDLCLIAKKIRLLTNKYKAYFLINGNINIALEVEADGVHIPDSGIPAAGVRRSLGNNMIIGKSAHIPLSPNNNDYEYIDFVTLSPVFNPGGKDYNAETIGINGLKKNIPTIPVPVYALGGIKPNYINDLKETGVSGIAVSSAIMKATDIKKTVEEYSNVLSGLRTA